MVAGGHYTRTTRTEEYERQLITVTAPDKLDGTLAADIENSKGERCKRRLSLKLFPVNIFCRNFFSLSSDYSDFLEEAMRTNCTKIEGGYSCGLCDKICRDLTRARQHLEAKHFPSVGYSCPQCGKHCKTKHALTCHISVYHRENASPTKEGVK